MKLTKTTDRSKAIYIENRIGRKTLQHWELFLQLSSITPLTTIDDLFNHLGDIFGKLHQKKHTIEIFRELKTRTKSFTDFYSKFIQLVSDLEYISEMFIQELKHKFIPRLQDWLNSGIELLISISTLTKCCLFIYKQMQVIDRIRDRFKAQVT